MNQDMDTGLREGSTRREVRCLHVVIALVAMTLVAACVTAPRLGVPVQEVDLEAVQGCEAMGAVEATTIRDTGSPAADLQRAKERLLALARERGATHLVMIERDLRYALAVARGNAYRCD